MASQDRKLQRIASGLATSLTANGGAFQDPELAGLSVEEAKQVHALAMSRSNWPIGAWKAGASNHSSRAGLGLDECFIGAIPEKRVMHSPATIAASRYRTHLIECEVALRLDIEAWLKADTDDVRPHLISVHAALELPDTRYAAIGQDGAAALVADFGAAGGALIGEGQVFRGEDSQLDGHTCILKINEETVAEGRIDALISDPVTLAAELKPEFRRLAVNQSWGEYILLGGMTPAVPIQPGDTVRAEFDRLGPLDLHVE